jgi:hypothetical protein
MACHGLWPLWERRWALPRHSLDQNNCLAVKVQYGLEVLVHSATLVATAVAICMLCSSTVQRSHGVVQIRTKRKYKSENNSGAYVSLIA